MSFKDILQLNREQNKVKAKERKYNDQRSIYERGKERFQSVYQSDGFVIISER